MADMEQLAGVIQSYVRGADAKDVAAAVQDVDLSEFLNGDIAAMGQRPDRRLKEISDELEPMSSIPCGIAISVALCSGHRFCQVK